ncbi:MAG: nickel-dependent lactate racemase [Fuerstiella sp.]|nr:nickel-dependent lactate racemase [Fuerstiella sp.]
MRIDLRYGKGTTTLELPDDVPVTVVRKPDMPLVDDPAVAVANAIAQPVGASCLKQLARGAGSACIAVCDITRPVPNHLFLRPLIEALMAGGIAQDRITVLVATGLHRSNEGAELEELIGDPWVLEHVVVANHFARNDADHVHLGSTSARGTVVRLDRRFVEADLRIATGLVEPHFMAGYSGGRKVIAPGLAHAETITTFHSARFMADPAAISCNFVDNPLHEEQLEIVRMLGGALAINTVIDEDRRLSFINFGEILQSHQQAVDFVNDYCKVFVPRRFRTVVTSAAGYPLDKTYYQTVKGMVCAMDILEPGGDLIIVSECSEGMGSAEFVAAQQRLVDLGVESFLRSILQKSHADIDEWQTQMQTKPMQVGRIHLVTNGLLAQDHALTGVNVTSSLQAAVHDSLSRSPHQSIAVIPEGPYVVPFFRIIESSSAE